MLIVGGYMNSEKFTFITLLLLLLSLSFKADAAWDAESIVINFPVDNEKNSPVREMGEKFQELVDQRLGALIVEVKLYDVGERDLFDELKLENAQMIAPRLPDLKRYSKRMQVFELPFLFYSGRAAEDFLNGVWGQRLLKSLQIKGISAHGYIHRGMKHLTSHESVTKPEELASKTLAIYGSNTAEKHYQALGVKIVNLPKERADIALEGGLVDSTENNWENIFEQNLHQQQKYILESGHAYSGNVLITTNKIWEGLPTELQPVLRQILDESIQYTNKYVKKLNESYKQEVLKNNETIIKELSVGERYVWIEAVRDVWSSYEDEIGTELINAAASHR